MIDLRSEAFDHDDLLERRLDALVPALLEETGIDCWVLIGREYAEDPVLASNHPIHADTAYSIELMGNTTVPEWDGQVVRFMLE